MAKKTAQKKAKRTKGSKSFPSNVVRALKNLNAMKLSYDEWHLITSEFGKAMKSEGMAAYKLARQKADELAHALGIGSSDPEGAPTSKATGGKRGRRKGSGTLMSLIQDAIKSNGGKASKAEIRDILMKKSPNINLNSLGVALSNAKKNGVLKKSDAKGSPYSIA